MYDSELPIHLCELQAVVFQANVSHGHSADEPAFSLTVRFSKGLGKFSVSCPVTIVDKSDRFGQTFEGWLVHNYYHKFYQNFWHF